MISIDQLAVASDGMQLLEVELRRNGSYEALAAWAVEAGTKPAVLVLTSDDLRLVMRRITHRWRPGDLRKVDLTGTTLAVTPFAERTLRLTLQPQDLSEFETLFRTARIRWGQIKVSPQLELPDGETVVAALSDCTLVGGFGYGALTASGRYSLVFTEVQALVVAPATSQILTSVNYSDLLAFRVDGPGAVTRGGAFIGGGFGLEGAAEGMVIASVLNALTTKTSVTTFVELQNPVCDMIFCSAHITPETARLQLKPIAARIRLATTASRAPARAHDLLEQLERLTALRDRGALTEEEFTTAKASLLTL